MKKRLVCMMLIVMTCLCACDGKDTAIDNTQKPVTDMISSEAAEGQSGTTEDAISKDTEAEKAEYREVSDEELAKLENDIFTKIQAALEGYATIENPTYQLQNRVEKEGSYKLFVTYDFTQIRDAMDSPFIQGMLEAKEELESQEKKDQADQIIQGFLPELNESLNVTESVTEEYILEYDEPSDSYVVKYHLQMDDIDEMYSLEDWIAYEYVENAEERAAMGRERLLEELYVGN